MGESLVSPSLSALRALVPIDIAFNHPGSSHAHHALRGLFNLVCTTPPPPPPPPQPPHRLCATLVAVQSGPTRSFRPLSATARPDPFVVEALVLARTLESATVIQNTRERDLGLAKPALCRSSKAQQLLTFVPSLSRKRDRLLPLRETLSTSSSSYLPTGRYELSPIPSL